LNAKQSIKVNADAGNTQLSEKKNTVFPAVYSVLLPVYKGDSPDFLKIAVDSMLHQTIPPEEIVIAVDGPITPDLESVIHEYETRYGGLFSVYRYKINEGLGKLLNKTLPLCRNEYIARMDADDYSMPERIEKQFAILDKHTDIDVVGCNVDEFDGEIKNTVAHVILPENPNDIYQFAKTRCPIRHPTLLFKKTDVLKAGNYSVQAYVQDSTQDYDLIVKLLQTGSKVFNIQQPLVYMRISKEFYNRRSGLRYLRSVYITKRNFLKSGFMSFKEFLLSFGSHSIVMIMPVWLRKFIYNKLLRG
jgi:glycosyltransferase involved in cell wall biosynthesis